MILFIIIFTIFIQKKLIMSLYRDQYIIQIQYINNIKKNYIVFSNNKRKLYDIFENKLDNTINIEIVKFFNNQFETLQFGNFSEDFLINNSEREKLFNWISNQYIID